mgnify:FL=1
MFCLDPDVNVGFLLYDVSRLMRAWFDERAQAFGLTRAQWRVLVHLAGRQGINQRSLAEILEIENVTLSRHVDRLERDGWLERRADPEDRRAWCLYLTDAAGPMLDRMEARATETQAKAMEGLSEAERAQLIDMLTRIKSNVSPAREARKAPTDAAAGG